MPDLQEIWRVLVNIPDFCFSELKTLIVDGCKFLSDVLPFTLLPLLPKLEELEVRNCDSVKTIFDVKRTNQDISSITFPLKKLVLSELPNLETVWNEDPRGILCMKHLQEVYVENCKCLTSVFPSSVVEDLEELGNLVLKQCEGLIAIVAEDNPADPERTNLKFTLHSVKSLTLWDLPNFKYNNSIYSIHEATPTFELITPNLQHLILGENELKMIADGEFEGNHFHTLKFLTLCFHIESDVFPEYAFLQQVPNVGELVVCSGSFKEIFSLQSQNNVDCRLLLKLKNLHFKSLGELVSHGSENSDASKNSWMEPSFENLEIPSFSRSKKLVVFFSNLTHLKVEHCNSMLYLFTSSIGKSLVQLKRMEVKLCTSIEEIVSEKGDESNKDEIIFERLQVLYLKKLNKLTCFCPGNFTLSFPSLKKVYVINCGSVKTFSPVNTIDHSINWYSADNATPQVETDLNSAVSRMFEEKASDADEDNEHGDDD